MALARDLVRCRIIAQPPGRFARSGVLDVHLIHVNLMPTQTRWSMDANSAVTERFPANSICWAPAGRRLTVEMDCPTWTLFVEIEPEAATDLFTQSGAVYRVPQETITYVTDADAAAIATIASDRLRAGAMDADDAVLGALAEALVLRAGRLADGGTDGRDRRIDARIARVLTHVDANLDGDLSANALARTAGMSRSHFARSFRDALGTASAEFVRRRRLDRAVTMLRHSEASIAEVARVCGFRDQSAMTAAFRRERRTTPAAVRRGERTLQSNEAYDE